MGKNKQPLGAISLLCASIGVLFDSWILGAAHQFWLVFTCIFAGSLGIGWALYALCCAFGGDRLEDTSDED